MEDKVNAWKNVDDLTWKTYVNRATMLISKGYPVPTNSVYKLAEILYNKEHEHKDRTGS